MRRDAGEIDLYAAGRNDVPFDGVDFQSVTDYDGIDPVAGSIELRPEGNPHVVLTVPNVRLDAGKTHDRCRRARQDRAEARSPRLRRERVLNERVESRGGAMPNKDEVKGKFGQVKGQTKQKIGEATDNERLRDDGVADEAAGDVQESAGKVKRHVGDAVKDIGDRIKKG